MNASIEWDEHWYVNRYPDLAKAVAEGRLGDPLDHYLIYGLKEGRFPSQAAEERARTTGGASATVSRRTVGNHSVPSDHPLHGEAAKTFQLRLANGFFSRYLSGDRVLDVGYKAGRSDAVPVLPHAIGVDLDYPGYDGTRLPFDDGSVDTVFSSHVLEHVVDPLHVIRDWFRVLKTAGFIVCIVPHQYLYERKRTLPSQWSNEHLRFYSPASLLAEFEAALEPNTYRLRHLCDNDLHYRYDLGPEHHPGGCYEIELVLQKISPPEWKLA